MSDDEGLLAKIDDVLGLLLNTRGVDVECSSEKSAPSSSKETLLSPRRILLEGAREMGATHVLGHWEALDEIFLLKLNLEMSQCMLFALLGL